jgi:hypothetical protein
VNPKGQAENRFPWPAITAWAIESIFSFVPNRKVLGARWMAMAIVTPANESLTVPQFISGLCVNDRARTGARGLLEVLPRYRVLTGAKPVSARDSILTVA